MKKRKKGENDKKFKTNNKLSGKIFPLDLYFTIPLFCCCTEINYIHNI